MCFHNFTLKNHKEYLQAKLMLSLPQNLSQETIMVSAKFESTKRSVTLSNTSYYV